MSLKINKLVIYFFLGLLISCKEQSEEQVEATYLDTETEYPVEEVYGNDVVDTISSQSSTFEVPFSVENGVTKIPVWINGVGLEFIFDTGASDTMISVGEAKYLFEKGKLTQEDILGSTNYQIADGSIVEGMTIILREVKVGTKIVSNVEASVVNNISAPLLLGQSVLNRFGKITIDNERQVFIFSNNRSSQSVE